ncbi:MAG: MFS transporter [Solirubrobacteraceae bacterium]
MPSFLRPRTSVSPWIVLVVVCFAQFMVVLDATIVNVALPSIQRDLHLSNQNLQWIVNAYTLVFGGFLLLGGRAADLLGRRRLFVTGVALFSAASLVNALATSGGMLIVARGFQGLGGALVSPAALSIITTTFAEGPKRTKALSVWGGIAAGGAAFGLLLGGLLTETLSWRWNFIVNVPVGIGVLIAAMRLVPESRQEGATRHFDVAGATTVTGGLMLLVYTIVKAQTWGWGSATTLAFAAGALAVLGAFVAIELRSPQPLVRLSFFRIRSISTANAAMFLVAGAMFGMFYFASLYVQEILGYGPLTAGLAFLPVSLGIMGGAALSQQLIGRLGVKRVVITGMSLGAAGLTVLASTTSIDGTYLALLAGLLPMAVGMGMTFVPLTLIATAGVAAADAGLASGTFNTSQQVGGALGLAVLATLASDKTTNVLAGSGRVPSVLAQHQALVDGFQVAFIASAILMAIGLATVSVLLRRRDVAAVDAADAVPVPA